MGVALTGQVTAGDSKSEENKLTKYNNLYDRLRKKRDELLILLHQRKFMIQYEKVLQDQNDEVLQTVKSELQDDQFMSLDKKDDAAATQKRDKLIDEVIEILKNRGTNFKKPKGAFVKLVEEYMEEVDLEIVEQNQTESARILTAIKKKHQTFQNGISVTKQICEQCSSQSLFHLIYKVLVDEVEEALPNVDGFEKRIQEVAKEISQEKARVAEEEKEAADAEVEYQKLLKQREEEDAKDAEQENEEGEEKPKKDPIVKKEVVVTPITGEQIKDFMKS